VAAPDKFRGTQSAAAVASAIADGARRAGWTCNELPLADGGEGTLDAFGGANRSSTVTGPLGEPIEAAWRLDGDLAVIEGARTSGLVLAGGKENNDPLRATTRGTGELIAEAIESGARQIIVGVGGSASTDGGLGCVLALRSAPFDSKHVSVRVACDVRTSFLHAARVFAPQKGAGPDQVLALTDRLHKTAAHYSTEFGVDVNALEGSGAAGGLAGGLAALGAELLRGFDLVADSVGLDQALRQARIAITGEGRFDLTSLNGKVVGGVADRAWPLGVHTVAIVGDGDGLHGARLDVISLVRRFGHERAFDETLACVADATEQLLLCARD
jgi:glycerate kinase